MSTILSPFVHGVSAVLAGAHHLFRGLPPGLAWSLAIVVLVCAIRGIMLPLVAHGIVVAQRNARARPAMMALQRKYKGQLRDAEAMKAMREERKAIQAEHGMSNLGCLTLLLQLPLIFALFRVLSDVAHHKTIGVLNEAQVQSFNSATVFGVRLAEQWAEAWRHSPTQALAIGLFPVLAALLSFFSMRWFGIPNTPTEGMPPQFADVYGYMPLMAAGGLMLGAMWVPTGLVVYWAATNAWTFAQQAVVKRHFPNPCTPAYDQRRERLGLPPDPVLSVAASKERQRKLNEELAAERAEKAAEKKAAASNSAAGDAAAASKDDPGAAASEDAPGDTSVTSDETGGSDDAGGQRPGKV